MMRLIDADELIKHACRSTEWSHGEHPMVVEVDDIDDAPTVDADPVKHAHWIIIASQDVNEKPDFICSSCYCISPVRGYTRYCPNCGAMMLRGEQDG